MSRGRGRGTGLSFNAELLGVGRGQEAIPASLLTPPPLYPPRLAPPCPLVEGPETDYLLAVRKEFLHQMKHSGFQLGGGSSSTTGATTALKVDRYSDRYQTRQDVPLQLDWSRFPSELRPENRKRRVKRRPVVNLAQVKNPNLVGQGDVINTLDELEKKEKSGNKSEDETEKKEGGSDGEDEDKPKLPGALEDSEGELEDEEMDDGTDYANNYFDNGEEYGDEDEDNLDEGGIY